MEIDTEYEYLMRVTDRIQNELRKEADDNED